MSEQVLFTNQSLEAGSATSQSVHVDGNSNLALYMDYTHGAATAVTVSIECSVDNVNWYQLCGPVNSYSPTVEDFKYMFDFVVVSPIMRAVVTTTDATSSDVFSMTAILR